MSNPGKLRSPRPADAVGGDALLRHMVEAVEDYAIYMLDLDGNVLTWNSGAERAKGYTAAEIIGRNYACFFTPEAIARGLPHKELREARKRGRYREEGWRVRKDGSLFWAEVVLTAARDDDGVMVGFAKVTRDLTEKREQDNALRQAKELAEEANKAKSDFLANMSHELRTPLNAIIGFSEVLQSELFGALGAARYKEYADHINSSGTHLLGLINDILDLSKLDAGKVVLELEDADLAGLAAETIHLLDNQAMKAAVTVSLEGEESLRLRFDVRRVRQILLNLLSNALKFTPEGGHVTVAVAEQEGKAVLMVCDNGIGMDADAVPRALSRFGQIESGLSRKYQGTGLGLPLVKQLAEMHGGSLALESTPGIGTKVTIRLPLR